MSLYKATASEDEEMMALFSWAKAFERVYPCLWLMYHVPNEGKRSLAVGVRLKRMGLKPGVSDVCLPVARGGYHGLYMEMKTDTGTVSSHQREFLRTVEAEGYFAMVCYGWQKAASVIERYVRGEIVR